MERGVHNEENKTPGDETGFGDEYKLKGKLPRSKHPNTLSQLIETPCLVHLVSAGGSFITSSCVLATDCEKVSTLASNGLNLQGVDIRCSGQFLSNGQGSANSGVDRCFFTCQYEGYLEFRAGSVILLT